MKIHLNLGSNLGDRRRILADACGSLRSAFEPCTMLVSDPVESEPWGYESPNPFLNCGVLIILDRQIDPLTVLDMTQAIERQIGGGAPHRNPDGTYCDRPIDIDIITIDDIRLSTPRLTLPHPRAPHRPWVTAPLHQLEALAKGVK